VVSDTVAEVTETISIVSGYFNPLHVGHVRMMREARKLGDMLIVIVNNDAQQVLKKGTIIMREDDRAEIVEALACVDRVVVALDTEDGTVRETLAALALDYPGQRLIFANGGDRRDAGDVAETEICASLGIELRFGVGGDNKADSSSRINAAMDPPSHRGYSQGSA
jgi:cytidyltransferase-like protein